MRSTTRTGQTGIERTVIMQNQSFTEDQKQYLQGFVSGTELFRNAKGLPGLSGLLGSLPVLNQKGPGSASGHTVTVGGSNRPDILAQDRTLAEGKKLCNEEKAKRDNNPLEVWDAIGDRATQGVFPKGTDVFLTKYEGLFFVAPAQDSFMVRLRLAGGIVTSHQFRGVANLAENFGGGYSHVTTRSNLQFREIPANHAMDVLMGLHDLGIVNRGAGADNIRNITASPTAGIDPQEWIDTRPLARQMHHYILNHPEMYCLPRKFNIAFDGGGTVSTVADTNDIGFFAVRINPAQASSDFPAGIYFRLELGGITGHKDFSKNTGILLRPEQCLPAAVAILKTFIEHGDRTDRKKARLKYLLDLWGFEQFLEKSNTHLPFAWPKFQGATAESPASPNPIGHVDFHPQKQKGLHYVGVVLPVGKMTCEQMRGVANISDQFGSGDLRLTVWQNVLITNIKEKDIPSVKLEIEKLGLHWSATHIRAGLVACTGSKGCKFAASDTKGHAELIAQYLESRLNMDQPVNIHLTGCHHSCAQHYIGDIGLLGTKVAIDEDMVDGYTIFVGGGHGQDRSIARELFKNVPSSLIPEYLENILRCYLIHRSTPSQRFFEFAQSIPIEQFQTLAQESANQAKKN